MRIKKTSQYIEGGATISNVYGTSQENGYSQEYINGLNTYSTSEIDTGKVWIDGKKIYRKVVSNTMGTTNGAWKDISAFTANYIDTIVKMNGIFKYSNGARLVIPFSRVTDSSYNNREYVLFNCNPTTGNVSVIGYHPSNYSLMSGQPVIVIVEYTKA